MKSQFSLESYQKINVDKIAKLTNDTLLSNGKKSISLKAPTGAGKTVMLIAVMEEVFKNMSTIPFNIIWVSSSPDLNEQSQIKIEKFSNEIMVSNDTEIIHKDTFSKFEDNKIYFANYGKFSANSKLSEAAPDKNRDSIWEQLKMLSNSNIRTLLIIDEAHKGTVSKNKSEEKIVGEREQKTIVKNIIEHLSPNVVIGVSATPQDFDKTMSVLGYRDRENYNVLPKEVIDSGVVKSKIINKSERNPKHNVSQALISEAIKDYDSSFRLWDSLKNEGIDIEPIMLVQIDNGMEKTNDFSLLISYLIESDFIRNGNIYHSFSESIDIVVSVNDEDFKIPYIKPNDINNRNNLRIVLFKEALGEGWDCPRAEILLSLRKYDSETKITQTVGRILRNPLYNNKNITEKYPVLNEVLLFTSKYNQTILEEIEKEFGQEAIAFEIEDLQNIKRLSLKEEVLKLFYDLNLKGYIREKVSKEDLDSLIQKVGENSNFKYNGIDDAYDYVLKQIALKIEDELNIDSINNLLTKEIISQSKEFEKEEKIENSESSEYFRQERDIDSEFNIVCREPFYEDELKIYLDEEYEELNISKDLRASLKEIEYKNGYRKEAIIKLIILSMIHNFDLKKYVNDLVNKMISEVIEETGKNLDNMNHKIKKDTSIYTPLKEVKIEDLEYSSINSFVGKSGKYSIDNEISGYELLEDKMKTSFDVFKVDSSIEGYFIKNIFQNNSYKYLLRNDSKKGLGIKYKNQSNEEGLFYPDFLAIKMINDSPVLSIIETKGLNDSEWKNKLIGLIDYIEEQRDLGSAIKFRFILMSSNNEYYEINSSDIKNQINGLNDTSIKQHEKIIKIKL